MPNYAHWVLLLLLLASSARGQRALTQHHLSINGFRNPSIGMEYQRNHLSIHAGYYPTNFTSGVTTAFFKAGLSHWFLPFGRQPIPSSFYAGAAYLRGLNQEYKQTNAVSFETGFRWFVWKGLNLRLGVIAVAAKDRSLQINPASGISYSINLL